MSEVRNLESYIYRINELLVGAYMAPLDEDTAAKFSAYLSLILRWNLKTNLTSIRDHDGIIARHFLESIACARALPAGVETLLDFGSGAGFPGIPIAICEPDIAVTLAESQGKKAAFLQEAVRVLGLGVRVHTGRAEELTSPFSCVTLRAVDRMADAVHAAGQLVGRLGWLAPMTTDAELDSLKTAAGPDFNWSRTIPLPGSVDRILAIGSRLNSPI
jgi:16S rRNA (guanine527-N7)-methyltransferase